MSRIADVAFAICCFLDVRQSTVRQSKAPNRLAPLSITRRTFLRLAAATGATTLAVDATLLAPNRLRVVRKDIALRRWPERLEGFTIALLSDLHFDPYFSVHPIEASVGIVNSLNPDLIVLTGDFVSIPPLDRSENPPKDSVATAKILVGTLKAHKVPAVGFINGSSVSDGDKIYPVRAEIVRMWRDEGFEVGLGGFNHLWFYDTPYDEYVANTEKNEAVARKILEGKTPIRYFSYPYLNTGKSSDEHKRFEEWLSQHGLASVKYTIDNNEWMYSYVYDLARNDNDLNLMQETQAAYLDYMSKMFDHYEAYSLDMFGRDIAQTMVLTPSRLVADTADRFFAMIEKRGYSFVPMSDAQSDPAYQTAEDFVGKAGISWFERWRMKEGKPLLDEPKVEPGVQKIWDAKKVVQGTKKKDS